MGLIVSPYVVGPRRPKASAHDFSDDWTAAAAPNGFSIRLADYDDQLFTAWNGKPRKWSVRRRWHHLSVPKDSHHVMWIEDLLPGQKKGMGMARHPDSRDLERLRKMDTWRIYDSKVRMLRDVDRQNERLRGTRLRDFSTYITGVAGYYGRAVQRLAWELPARNTPLGGKAMIVLRDGRIAA